MKNMFKLYHVFGLLLLISLTSCYSVKKSVKRSKPNSEKAVEAYHGLAKEHGLSLSQMALAFVTSRPFVTSNIIGATSMDQLKENIGSIEVELADEVLKGIEQIHENNPNPAP